METLIKELPEYYPNQVLTEASLNATSNFLEQQERLTRFGLTKTGIIENLEYRINPTSITIEEGFGVSTDGYFIAHNYKSGPQTYEFAKPYLFDPNQNEHNRIINDLRGVPFSSEANSNQNIANIQFYELLTSTQSLTDTEAVSLNSITSLSSHYKIVLYLELKTTQQDQCSTTSCDNAGSVRNYRTVPLLIIDNGDALIKEINTEIKLKNRIKLKRLSNLYQLAKNRDWNQKYSIITTEYARVNYQNTRTLLEKLNEIDTFWKFPSSLGEKFPKNNIAQLKAAIASLVLMQTTYIPSVDYRNVPFNYGYIAQQTPKSTIPKATAAFLKYTQSLKVHSFKTPIQREHPNAKIYFQAYYDFCHDLEQAINELILNYNNYINTYFSSYNNRLKKMLVLGRNDRYNYDLYRYYSIQNFANQEYREAKSSFFKHFNRVIILIRKFQEGFGQLQYKTEIKLIPSRYGNYLLEDRAIPYYYKQDLELDAAWVVTANKGLKTDVYQYRDLQAPYSHFVNNISSYNFIRVEGIIGRLIPTSRIFYPWLVDFKLVKIETEKQKANLVKTLSQSLFQEAQLIANTSVQSRLKDEISVSALNSMKDKLTTEMTANYSHLDAAVVNDLVQKITVDLQDKLIQSNQATASELTLNDLDKQIDFFNIPLRYEIFSLDNDHNASVLKQLESASGTKMGGTLVLFTKREYAGERIVASFMKYY